MNVWVLVALATVVTPEFSKAESFRTMDGLSLDSCLQEKQSSSQTISSEEFTEKLEFLFSQPSLLTFNASFDQIDGYLSESRRNSVISYWSQKVEEDQKNKIRPYMSARQFTRLFHSPGGCRTFVTTQMMAQNQQFKIAPATHEQHISYLDQISSKVSEPVFFDFANGEFYLEDSEFDKDDGVIFKISMGPQEYPIQTADLASYSPGVSPSDTECSGSCVLGYSQNRKIEAVFAFGKNTPVKDLELKFATTLAGAARRTLNFSGDNMNPGLRLILEEIVRSDDAKRRFELAQQISQERVFLIEQNYSTTGVSDQFSDLSGSIEYNLKGFIEDRTGPLAVDSAKISITGGLMNGAIRTEEMNRERMLQIDDSEIPAGVASVVVTF